MNEIRINRIWYGEESISYQVFVKPCPHRKVAIHVHPDASVTVDIPEDVSANKIQRSVQRQARWIWKQLDEIQKRQVWKQPRNYVSGEGHYYRGRTYVLKICEATPQDPKVKLSRGSIYVYCGKGGPAKRYLEKWYRDKALEVLQQRFQLWKSYLAWLNQDALPEIQLRQMSKRWGSCSKNKRISINPHLVKAPTRLIDYVLIHELCHLKELHHGKAFYQLLTSVLPDWQRRRRELDANSELYLNE